MALRVLSIVAGTTVDGPGLRTSVYLAGCSHHCPGCHNPESWDASGGEEMSVADIMRRIDLEDFDVTLTGGDPLYSPSEILPLLQAIKRSGRNLWLYTGYTYEQLLDDPERRGLLDYVDVLVDGPFRADLRDTSLRFRGSSNQRLIDAVRSSRGSIFLFE